MADTIKVFGQDVPKWAALLGGGALVLGLLASRKSAQNPVAQAEQAAGSETAAKEQAIASSLSGLGVGVQKLFDSQNSALGGAFNAIGDWLTGAGDYFNNAFYLQLGAMSAASCANGSLECYRVKSGVDGLPWLQNNDNGQVYAQIQQAYPDCFNGGAVNLVCVGKKLAEKYGIGGTTGRAVVSLPAAKKLSLTISDPIFR